MVCRRPRLPRRHRMVRFAALSFEWFRAGRLPRTTAFSREARGAFPPAFCRGKEIAWRFAGARDCRAGIAWFALRHCPSNGFGRAAHCALFARSIMALFRPSFAGVRKPHGGLPAPAIAAQAPHGSLCGIVLRMVSGGLPATHCGFFARSATALVRPPFAGVRKSHGGLPAPAIAAQAPHVSRHGIVLRMVSDGLRIAAFSRGAFISTLFQWFAPGSAPNAFRFEQHKAQDPAFSFSAS